MFKDYSDFLKQVASPDEQEAFVLAAAVMFPDEMRKVVLSLGWVYPESREALLALKQACALPIDDPGEKATPEALFNNFLAGLVNKWNDATPYSLVALLTDKLPPITTEVPAGSRRNAKEILLSLRNNWENRVAQRVLMFKTNNNAR